MTTPSRGEVWRVRFDPAEGAEIKKIRPSVVVSVDEVGILPLRIIVPITGWQDAFASRPWLVRLNPTRANGLSKASAADAFQVKSLSVDRFVERVGALTAQEIEEIAAAIVLCVGYI
jgi:mRNA interferase MazF